MSWLADGGKVGVPCVVVPLPEPLVGERRPAGAFKCETVGVWNLARPEVPVLFARDRGVTWEARDGQDMTGLDEVNYKLYKARCDLEFFESSEVHREGGARRGKKGLSLAKMNHHVAVKEFMGYLEDCDSCDESDALDKLMEDKCNVVKLIMSAATRSNVVNMLKGSADLRRAVEVIRDAAVAKMERGELLWYLMAAVRGVVI